MKLKYEKDIMKKRTIDRNGRRGRRSWIGESDQILDLGGC